MDWPGGVEIPRMTDKVFGAICAPDCIMYPKVLFMTYSHEYLAHPGHPAQGGKLLGHDNEDTELN